MAKEKTVPVTILKSLDDGQAPTFKLPITLQRLDGKKAKLTLTCNAMQKTEWAELRDERQRAVFERLKAAQAAQAAQGDAQPDAGDDGSGEAEAPSYLDTAIANIATHGMVASHREGAALDAALIMRFATGWSVTNPLNAESLALLEEKFGGSLSAILADYDRAILQGRLGNSD